jgi:hypothetical protein
VYDTDGRWIKCDHEVMQCLKRKGTSAIWHGRHTAGLLNARHYFTHAASTDGSLKVSKEGDRKVTYGIHTGIQEAPPDTLPCQQKKEDILQRVAQGMRGGGLPTTWEVIDAIYTYLEHVCGQ